MRRLNYSQRALRNALYDGVDSFERNNADEAPMMAQGLQAGNGNPPFDAQFDIQIKLRYFSVAAGVFTARTAAYMLANAPTLATQLAFFIFGLSDFLGGYKKIQGQFPLVLWQYGQPFTYGNGYSNTAFGVLDATALAQLQIGDVVMPITAVVGGVNYCCLAIIRCANVGYATLLGSTSSDSFVVNRVRYIQNDTSAAGLLQFNNPIWWQKLSLFGKYDTDNIAPTSQKSPDQFQNGIIDVNITKAITKEISFGSLINYDAVDLQWSVFVKVVNKLPTNL